MSKIVTLKCSSCNESFSYKIGANNKLTSLKDAMAHVTDPKESERLLDIYMSITKLKSQAELPFFSINPAEVLTNINYAACGDNVLLFDPTTTKALEEKTFNEKISASTAASQQKWANVLAKEGVVAFIAMYYCPKHKTLSKGLFLQIRWLEDKKERSYTYVNKCEQCGSPLILVDDCNIGFCHEGLPTIAKCKCGGILNAESVCFRP